MDFCNDSVYYQRYTHISDEPPLLLLKLVENPRIEKIPISRHARRAKVGLHDRVVSRVKLKHDEVAQVRLDRLGHVAVRIGLGADLDGVRRYAGAGLRFRRGFCC